MHQPLPRGSQTLGEKQVVHVGDSGARKAISPRMQEDECLLGSSAPHQRCLFWGNLQTRSFPVAPSFSLALVPISPEGQRPEDRPG